MALLLAAAAWAAATTTTNLSTGFRVSGIGTPNSEKHSKGRSLFKGDRPFFALFRTTT
ncbi:MAG: hypothetical protein RBJ76_20180 [Stenomitos frigidus ULC029]